MQAGASPFGSMGCQRGSSSIELQKLARNKRLNTGTLERQADASLFGSMGCQHGSSSIELQKLARNIDAIKILSTDALERQADASPFGSMGSLELDGAQESA
jgi:hypothetical protein